MEDALVDAEDETVDERVLVAVVDTVEVPELDLDVVTDDDSVEVTDEVAVDVCDVVSELDADVVAELVTELVCDEVAELDNVDERVVLTDELNVEETLDVCVVVTVLDRVVDGVVDFEVVIEVETVEVADDVSVDVADDVAVVVGDVASQRKVPSMNRFIMLFKSVVVALHSLKASVVLEFAITKNKLNPHPNTFETGSKSPKSWRFPRINDDRATPVLLSHGAAPNSEGMTSPLN